MIDQQWKNGLLDFSLFLMHGKEIIQKQYDTHQSTGVTEERITFINMHQVIIVLTYIR